jgi:hypothetical protein
VTGSFVWKEVESRETEVAGREGKQGGEQTAKKKRKEIADM